MTAVAKRRLDKSEKTLFTSLLLSAPGPIVMGMAVLSGFSATQVADFLRRTTELVALFVSWWTYRKIQRTPGMGEAEQARLERQANLFVGGAMGVSGVMMLAMAAIQLGNYRPSGNVTMGLTIAGLGVLTNGFFWLRYRALAREGGNSVISAQHKLYRAKTSVDLCVVIALAAVLIAPAHPVSRYVDLVGSAVVACYLLWNGWKTVRK